MNKKDFKECQAEDKKRILGYTKTYHIIFIVMTQHFAWHRWKCVKNMRKAAIYQEIFQAGNKLARFPLMWYLCRKNFIGNKLGFKMEGYSFNRKGLYILPQRFHGYPREVKNWRALLAT